MPTFICPTCRREVTVDTLEDLPWRPFCSMRCKAIDLGRWLNEEYRIIEELPVLDPDKPSGDAQAPDASDGD